MNALKRIAGLGALAALAVSAYMLLSPASVKDAQAADSYTLSGPRTVFNTDSLPGKGFTNGMSHVGMTNVFVLAGKEFGISAHIDGADGTVGTNLVLTLYKGPPDARASDATQWDTFTGSPTVTLTNLTANGGNFTTNFTVNSMGAVKVTFSTVANVYAKPLSNSWVKFYSK